MLLNYKKKYAYTPELNNLFHIFFLQIPAFNFLFFNRSNKLQNEQTAANKDCVDNACKKLLYENKYFKFDNDEKTVIVFSFKSILR